MLDQPAKIVSVLRISIDIDHLCVLCSTARTSGSLRRSSKVSFCPPSGIAGPIAFRGPLLVLFRVVKIC